MRDVVTLIRYGAAIEIPRQGLESLAHVRPLQGAPVAADHPLGLEAASAATERLAAAQSVVRFMGGPCSSGAFVTTAISVRSASRQREIWPGE